MSHTPEAWERLGRLLVSRRVQLDPGYRNRQKFVAATGLHERLVSDLENARRYSYRDTTIHAVEGAYGLAPGSIRQALEDPSLTEFPHRLGSTVLQVSATDSGTVTESETATPREPLQDPGDLGPNVYFDSLDRWEQALLLSLQQFPPEVRMMVLAYAQLVSGERALAPRTPPPQPRSQLGDTG